MGLVTVMGERTGDGGQQSKHFPCSPLEATAAALDDPTPGSTHPRGVKRVWAGNTAANFTLSYTHIQQYKHMHAHTHTHTSKYTYVQTHKHIHKAHTQIQTDINKAYRHTHTHTHTQALVAICRCIVCVLWKHTEGRLAQPFLCSHFYREL